MRSKIIIIDIDGVLSVYPGEFEKYASELLGKKHTYKELKSLPQYKLLKYSYRKVGIKRTLPLVNDTIPQIIDELKAGFQIWIVTTRKIDLSFDDTVYWLKTKKINYDKIFFVKNKVTFVSQMNEDIFAIIDDEIDNLIPFKNKGIITIQIQCSDDWLYVIKQLNKKNSFGVLLNEEICVQ